MKPREVAHVACLFIANLMLCSAVHAAGLFRAYLASDGSDAAPCTLQAPCRLLPAALTAVADGGEIWMLDSANYNAAQVEVTKSVTILAIPGALGSVVATGGFNGFNINTAGVKVTLRNLVIVHLANSQHGIRFAQGAELNVTECEIANMQSRGIFASATFSKLTVSNTVLRNNSGYGIYVTGFVVAALDGLHIKNSGDGVRVDDDARVTISNSVISGSAASGLRVNGGAGLTYVAVERSVLTGGLQGMLVQTPFGGAVVEVAASHNIITDNSVAGVYATEAPESSMTVVADGNTVTKNDIGIKMSGGTIYTRGNNTLKFNTIDVSGGSLTALAGQ